MVVRKLEIENPGVMSIAIRQEIERSDESRYDHRLHGVLLVANGQSCREVALLFGEDLRRNPQHHCSLAKLLYPAKSGVRPCLGPPPTAPGSAAQTRRGG